LSTDRAWTTCGGQTHLQYTCRQNMYLIFKEKVASRTLHKLTDRLQSSDLIFREKKAACRTLQHLGQRP
jgi:hypothetical protein